MNDYTIKIIALENNNGRMKRVKIEATNKSASNINASRKNSKRREGIMQANTRNIIANNPKPTIE